MCAYKVIVVDDDEMAAEALAFELEKKPEFSLDGIARNARQGKKLIAAVRPDLLFLDVEMPEMTGMELLRDIRDSIIWNMKVVFYTAYDKYMIEAIRESAFDYFAEAFSASGVGSDPASFSATDARRTADGTRLDAIVDKRYVYGIYAD